MKSAKKAKPKKKKAPKPIIPPPMKSRKKARVLTTTFHKLTKEKEEVLSNGKLSTSDKKEKLKIIQQKLDEMGGRKAYQEASILSTSFHKTSKWVFQILTKLGLRPSKGQPALKVLEVGAINTQLLSCPWLAVDAIDLESRHERIRQIDFFALKPQGTYDVLVSSMVINCVPDALKRGEMLQGYHKHLKERGILFLMLPLLCLRNSKFMTEEHFSSLLTSLGFELLERKDSPKIAHFALRRVETDHSQEQKRATFAFPPAVLRPGKGRIDFSVCLSSSSSTD